MIDIKLQTDLQNTKTTQSDAAQHSLQVTGKDYFLLPDRQCQVHLLYNCRVR